MCLVLSSLTIKQKTHGHFKIPFTPKQIVNIKKVRQPFDKANKLHL